MGTYNNTVGAHNKTILLTKKDNILVCSSKFLNIRLIVIRTIYLVTNVYDGVINTFLDVC